MIKHHARDETLFRYANGLLERGPRIVVSVHVGGCAVCAARIAEFRAMGGAFLDETEPAAMKADALNRAMAELDAEVAGASGGEVERFVPARAELGIRLPAELDGCGVGPWRWAGPGVRWSRITLPDDRDANVMLLKVAAGRRLPDHTHAGSEYTQILKGSFSDARGSYHPGDMDEADDEVHHQPVVDKMGECICLAALEGNMRLSGFLGRLFQPLLGN